ncbi:hypothetical protein IEQ34_020347 [Dendrobium chrysotoxum]|uniref:Uncharacterized protein n=1 Tax=Dendrobium chrysotoxum TaxID=161865 RepID=A0AAV7FKH5_DENCH|nr:hypothetical protein IEQ34_020347 [Dendrobium chrysotoxum]
MKTGWEEEKLIKMKTGLEEEKSLKMKTILEEEKPMKMKTGFIQQECNKELQIDELSGDMLYFSRSTPNC